MSEADDILRELTPMVMDHQRMRRTIVAIMEMDADLLRAARRLAAETLQSQCGYGIMERNRADRCQNWSQDFRETVLHAAEVLKVRDKIVIHKILKVEG